MKIREFVDLLRRFTYVELHFARHIRPLQIEHVNLAEFEKLCSTKAELVQSVAETAVELLPVILQPFSSRPYADLVIHVGSAKTMFIVILSETLENNIARGIILEGRYFRFRRYTYFISARAISFACIGSRNRVVLIPLVPGLKRINCVSLMYSVTIRIRIGNIAKIDRSFWAQFNVLTIKTLERFKNFFSRLVGQMELLEKHKDVLQALAERIHEKILGRIDSLIRK